MRTARLWAMTGAVGLAIGCTVATTLPAAASPAPGPAARAKLQGSLTPAVQRSPPAGKVAGPTAVSFDLLLTLRNAAGAQALVKAVSNPGSAAFHHYLTD